MLPPMLPIEQIERFALAVELLGGQRPAARLLDLSEEAVRDLCNGRRPLHVGILRSLSRALILHADACRLIERRLSPAFLGNILPGQGGPRDGAKIPGEQEDQPGRRI